MSEPTPERSPAAQLRILEGLLDAVGVAVRRQALTGANLTRANAILEAGLLALGRAAEDNTGDIPDARTC